MIELTENLIGAIIMIIVWIAWTFLSETRYNHGILVAFLMPLIPIIIPVLVIVFYSIKFTSYFVFIAIGRREDHEEFIRKTRIRSRVFLLF